MPRWLALATAAALLWAIGYGSSLAQSPLEGFLVDLEAKRISLMSTLPDDWRICDGIDGACIGVRELRAMTELLKGDR